jgi:type IV pilus assembly protein PilQ
MTVIQSCWVAYSGEEETQTISKTPLLGDLPFLGTLFRRTENSSSKTELLIFITPSIINELR